MGMKSSPAIQACRIHVAGPKDCASAGECTSSSAINPAISGPDRCNCMNTGGNWWSCGYLASIIMRVCR